MSDRVVPEDVSMVSGEVSRGESGVWVSGKKSGFLEILHFNDVYEIEERINEPVGGAPRFISAINNFKTQGQENLCQSSVEMTSTCRRMLVKTKKETEKKHLKNWFFLMSFVQVEEATTTTIV